MAHATLLASWMMPWALMVTMADLSSTVMSPSPICREVHTSSMTAVSSVPYSLQTPWQFDCQLQF
jgi:hypothetical protein